MKRLLSAILVLTMILALVPAVFAAEGIELPLEGKTFSNSGTGNDDPQYSFNNGVAALETMAVRRYGVTGTSGSALFVKFSVSQSGNYTLELKTSSDGVTNRETAAAPAIHIGDYKSLADTNFKLDAINNKRKIGYFKFSEFTQADTYMSMTIDSYANETSVPIQFDLEANKDYYMIFHCDIKSLDLNKKTSNGELSAYYECYNVSNAYSGITATEGSTTLIGINYEQNMYISGIRLIPVVEEPEEDEDAYGEVSFAQTTNIDGFNGIDIDSVSRGGSVTLTAHKKNIEGYKFVGWKRGADTSDENAWVDIDGDTYSVWSNTYLTAVYEKEDNKNVAFWNQNGAYIGSMTESVYNEQTTLFTPKLTGFGTFLGWFTDGNKPFTAGQTLADGTTNAVAQYTASAITGVKHNGTAVADAGTYNAPVELNKANANTVWLRDGEPVAYGTTYKFNVWDATDITEGTEEITDKVPVAILDYSDAHKAYMLEYDAGDYEIVEAGIIFGKDTASIKTYTSQRKEKHNQFTVPEEGDLDATGYIIYTLDDGVSYKTKYVSVKTEE
ncbi:MAG: hypothetical protein IJP38_02170 [Oscillospiraceae bacterium]|nr:hypothetical protein [Oscillospiraceae bacterium]